MFDSQEKSSTKYTLTVALLVMAFVFSPAILLVSRPVGLTSISLAAAGSAVCLVFAWLNWKRYSQLTMPSVEAPRPRLIR